MGFTLKLLSEESDSVVGQNQRVVSNYSRTYQYKLDLPVRPTESQIAVDVAIFPGSPYPNDPNATAHKIHIGPGPTPTRPPHLCYTVKVDWSTMAAVPNAVSTDPATMRTQWSITPSIQTRYVVKDRHDNMILNAAGQPFDGGIPVGVRLVTATAKRTVAGAGYNKNTVLANSGKLNSAAYLGAAIGTLQVDISATEKFEGSYNFWDEQYVFAYDKLGWQPRPMNAGFFQLVYGDPDNLQRITNGDVGSLVDPNGLVQEPEPLMPDGSVVPPGSANRPSLCNFIDVDYFASFDFASLLL